MMKVAVIGPGNIAHTYMQALTGGEKIKITAVLGRREETVKPFADTYGINWYTDADIMYSSEDIDAVLICTPTFTHEEIVNKAIENKVHIMCEKPFVLNDTTAQQLFFKAQQNNVRIMVMQVVRFWPEYVKIKKLVESGELGDIKNVYAHRLSSHPNWCSWHKDPQKSGGGLYDLHIHDIDWLYYVFGKVKNIYAVGKQTETGCWNNVSTILNFENGISAVAEGFMDITGNWPFCTDVRINGSKATAEFINKTVTGENGEKVNINNFTIYPGSSNPTTVNSQKYNPYKYQTEYFVDCIERNIPFDIVPNDDVVYVLKILKTIEKSLITGKIEIIY